MDKKKPLEFYIHNFSQDSSTIPQYIEKITKGGYMSYGDDNLYPDYLISLMNRSAKHNAILKRKAMMIGGNGWSTTGLSTDALRFLDNPYNDMNLSDIAFRCSYDLEIFGSFAVEVIYSKDMTKIAEINYIPSNKIRVSENREYVYYADDWSNLKKFGPIKKPILDLNNPTSSQILYVKEYRPGSEYYGQPEYLSCVNWIELEWEISLFHLNQVKRGFAPSMVITFKNGIPSDEEMRDIIRQLQNDYEGAINAGKTMFLFSDGEDRAPSITPIDLNDSDERFIELNKEITQGILTGHSVTNPGLFGISTPGELGQKSVILESLEIFQSMYVNPKQDIIERTFSKLARFNNIEAPLVLNKYNLDLQKITE